MSFRVLVSKFSKRIFGLGFAIVLCFSALAGADEKELKTVLAPGMPEPLMFWNENSTVPPTGVTVDYLTEIEKELKRKVKILILPKARIVKAVADAELDFNCYTNPIWAGPVAEKFYWTQDFFIVRDFLISSEKTPLNLDSIPKGSQVATVLNYKYPTLQPYFDSGKLVRSDVRTEDMNVKNFLSKRFPYIVMDSIHIAFFKKELRDNDFAKNRIEVGNFAVKCWVHSKSSLKGKDLDAAIGRIKADGRLEKIFNKYGLSTKE